LIVKVPLDEGDAGITIEHSQIEISVLRRILRSKKRYRTLKKYMPKVYYFNPATGVILVREYQKVRNPYSKKFEKVRKRIEKEFMIALQLYEWDSHEENFAKDTNGRLVLLDLGCLKR
jgi:hypothetical protein